VLLIPSSVSDNCQQYHAVVISQKKAAVEDNAQPHHGATGRVTPSGRRTAYARTQKKAAVPLSSKSARGTQKKVAPPLSSVKGRDTQEESVPLSSKKSRG